MQETIVIDRRFRGPPESGHGGYVSALVAQSLGGPAEATLRKPSPLGKPLVREQLEDGTVELRDGQALIAEARAATLELDVPEPPPLREVEAAQERYIGLKQQHIYPTCFVCGTDRESPDGFRLFPGAVNDTGLIAALWVPDASLGDKGGVVKPEFLWSVLDCPGGIAVMGDGFLPLLLGQMTARVEAGVRVGGRFIALGWPIGVEGRKYFAGSALYSEAGDLVGVAKATWIRIKDAEVEQP